MMQRFPVAWQCRIDSFNTPEPLGTTLKDKIEPHSNVLKLFPLNRSSFKIHYVSSLFVLSRSYIILKSESLCNQLGDYKPPKFKHKVRFLRLLPGDYSQFYEWG